MVPLITYMCVNVQVHMHSIIIKTPYVFKTSLPNLMLPKSSIRIVLFIILVAWRAGPASTTATDNVLTGAPVAAP